MFQYCNRLEIVHEWSGVTKIFFRGEDHGDEYSLIIWKKISLKTKIKVNFSKIFLNETTEGISLVFSNLGGRVPFVLEKPISA